MRFILIIIIMATLCAGCSHSYYIRSLDSEEFQSFQDRASKHSCTVTQSDGTEYKATNIILAEDTTRFLSMATGTATHIPTKRIRSIAFSSRGSGVGEGTFLGLFAGVAVGATLGYMGGSEYCSGGGFCFTREESAILGALLIGVPAAALGALVGSARGTRYIYHPFPEDLSRDLWDTYFSDP